MCRIFGHFDADVTPHELKTVAALQRHGGPDAQTHVTGDGWGLGNNRLAIMDLDGGDQPYVLGDITAVFNGEIYNHQELRDSLVRRGHTFSDTCDGSIIPALYAEYGTAFVDHLDGMFAVAVVDLRHEPRLILATDDIGMKPLYYHWDAARRHLYFSSELPALLSFQAVRADAWAPGLDAYLATKTPFGEQTMFEGIKVMPPAVTMDVTRRHGPRMHHRVPTPAQAATDPQTAADQVRSLLRREVHRLTRADVPVCAITSGGLDSSLVTALAAEKVPELHTFNIAYRGTWPADERAFARQVAERCGTRHHQVEIDPATFPDLLADVVWHLGQPNADPIALSTYALFNAVHNAGFKVAVTGDAADELFGGYARIKEALAAPEGTDWIPGYLQALSAIPRQDRMRLYSPEYRAYITDRGTAEDHLADHLRSARTRRLETITRVEVGQRLPAYHLRRVDHLSMASSVEVRLPFCQPSVVRYALALPDHLKVKDGQVKRALYGAARGLLPDTVLNRPKQPFTLPITAMLTPGQPLLDFARDMLTASRVRARGYLDPQAVSRLLAAQQNTPDDRSALAIWSLLIHELWQEQFQGGRTRTHQFAPGVPA